MFFAPSAAGEPPILRVSELNRAARQLLEQSFPLSWIAGEISNLTMAASGHWYFSLKDEKAQVRCAMFRHKNQYLEFVPENGMQVEVRALVTLYEPRGEFQLNVENMRRAGLGALYEAFEKLKAKLEKEGLLDAARKRPLPALPRQIGVVTSLDAAALRDVLTTLKRRMPSIPVIIYPTPVQGEGAAEKITAAIRAAGTRNECDVIILCRGGGSIEDLWQFNQEIVAREIAACPIPVVCGVGHETDFTIADFVADRRAPTPTAAAEMVSPNRAEWLMRLEKDASRLTRWMERELETRMQHLDHLSKRLVHPGERLRLQNTQLAQLKQRLFQATQHNMTNRHWQIQQARQKLMSKQPDITGYQRGQSHLATRLALAMQHRLGQAQQRVTTLTSHLGHLNPQAVLERGYSIVRNEQGNVIRDSGGIETGNELDVTFAAGSAKTKVISKSK
jgi:exodeoxyribonuclease VII large subunit